jgi:flavin-binding protein dodecin
VLLVGGTARKHEAAIAIAALDEADVVVDHIIYARVAERGVNLAGTVAKNAVMFGADGFWRGDGGHVTRPSNAVAPLQSGFKGNWR